MFALIENVMHTEMTGKGLLKRLRNRNAAVRSESVEIMGMKALRLILETPQGLRRRQLEKRLRTARMILGRSKVDRVCFRQDFPYRKAFPDGLFREMDCQILNESMAGPILVKTAAGGDKTALFHGRYALDRGEQVLIDLCASFRYLVVCLSDRDRLICDSIRRKYGISVIEQPTMRQLLKADTALFFTAPSQRMILSDGCTVFAVSDEALRNVRFRKKITSVTYEIPDSLKRTVPEGYSADPFLSEALLRGIVRRDQIRVEEISISSGGASSPQ